MSTASRQSRLRSAECELRNRGTAGGAARAGLSPQSAFRNPKSEITNVNPERIRELLRQVEAGELTADLAMQALKWAPYEDVGGYARLDVHRRLRTRCPDVVHCEPQ